MTGKEWAGSKLTQGMNQFPKNGAPQLVCRAPGRQTQLATFQHRPTTWAPARICEVKGRPHHQPANGEDKEEQDRTGPEHRQGADSPVNPSLLTYTSASIWGGGSGAPASGGLWKPGGEESGSAENQEKLHFHPAAAHSATFPVLCDKAKSETIRKSAKVRAAWLLLFFDATLVIKRKPWIMQTYNSCKLIPNEMETSQVLICWTRGRSYNELQRTDAKICPLSSKMSPTLHFCAQSHKLLMPSIWFYVFLLRRRWLSADASSYLHKSSQMPRFSSHLTS